MSDQQPDPTRIAADPADASTVDAPARWSGSAAVPPPSAKQSRWTRSHPGPAIDEQADRETITPVDPWADHDTPWDPMPLPPPEPLPPTRVELPPRPLPQSRPNRIPVAPRPAPPPRPMPPAPPRRRRRWPRNLALFTLLSAVCCCGIPAWFAYPAAGQYPVSAVLPDSVSDLSLRDDRASQRAAERLTTELNDTNAFAGVYSDGNGKRVTVFGVTGLRLTPQQDVQAQIDRLTAEYDIRDVQSFDLGVAGVHERCGVGRSSGSTVVVCAWADHGSLVTVLLTRRSVADSAELTGVLRSAVLVRG